MVMEGDIYRALRIFGVSKFLTRSGQLKAYHIYSLNQLDMEMGNFRGSVPKRCTLIGDSGP